MDDIVADRDRKPAYEPSMSIFVWMLAALGVWAVILVLYLVLS